MTILSVVQELIDKGYRPIPYYEELGKFSKRSSGESYPSADSRWGRAAYPGVALEDDMLLIDLDGYKDGAATPSQIALALGMTESELNKALVQTDISGKSIHWLFRIPNDADISSANGVWMPHVDLKGRNCMMNVKPHKMLMLPPADALQVLDLSRVSIPFPQRASAPGMEVECKISDVTSDAGKRQLNKICEKLADASEGGRNSLLNECALQMAHYVAGGDISHSDAVEKLTAVALSIGLSECEITATIDSGFKRGMTEPRLAPRSAAEIFADVPHMVTPTIPSKTIAQDTPVLIPEPILRSGFQLVAGSGLINHFKGCVYVTDAHRIFTPNGEMLKEAQFNASIYGGYVFALDDNSEKTTTKAFTAFTESQCVAFPKVDGAIFAPRYPSGAIIEDEGRRLVNTFIPVDIRTVEGDPTPFLNHMRRLLPDDRDRAIAMAHAAAVVQYPGYKFQWAPLYQGCEGNGKTLLTRCVAYAVGQRYTHMPPAAEISEKFNSWLFGNIFIGVEDIYVPGEKIEVLEVLKPMITGDRLAKRAMQQDQVMMTNCANFIFNSNHKNAVKKTINDRRFCIFYTAQQEAADLKRDGMDGDYFPDLYDWLKADGYAIVAHYLKTYQIPDELNPTIGCQRAPVTSSTGAAISESMGGVEQEILEAIDEGRSGFAGGWVSSMALDELIAKLRAERQIPRGKRVDLMRSLGYELHPALRGGRVDNPLLSAGGRKPKLFVKAGHLALELTKPADVARHYEAAQGDPIAMGMVAASAAV